METTLYGIWKINCFDNNKVEVYKQGTLCTKAAPALREIAKEIGLETNPEWRTSQLRRNVLKAIANIPNTEGKKTEAPIENVTATPEEQPKKRKTTKKDIVPIQKYDANSIENSKEFWENDQEWDESGFFGEYWTYTKAQYNTLLKKAKAGDAIAQFKCGYITKELVWSQYIVEVSEDYPCEFQPIELKRAEKLLENYKDIIIDFTEEDAYKWLEAAAEQGLGIAAIHVMQMALSNPRLSDYLPKAMEYYQKVKELIPWKTWLTGRCYGRIERMETALEDALDMPILEERIEEVTEENEELKEKIEELENDLSIEKNKKNQAENQYNQLEEQYHELVQKYQSLQDENKHLKQEYSVLQDTVVEIKTKYRALQGSSKGEEKIAVRITIETEDELFLLLHGFSTTQRVVISKVEYKSLLNGSMKSRIAWVRNKFGISSDIAAISGVGITAL